MSGQAKLNILLVEDDSDDYRLLMKQLCDQECGVFVDWAESLADAAEKIGERSFDVILTDLSLPGSHGFATVERLRSLVGELPIIVLTSLDDECMEQDLLECGAQDYLVKGELNGRATMRAITHAIQRQRMQNELAGLLEEREENQLRLRQQAALLKRKNRRLKRLYRTGQEFVDNVSHDFRTPLTVIKDYVAIIREGMVGDINVEQQQMLDKVSVRADDLNNMVDDLLDVSKLEAGLLGAWRRDVSVSGILERVESMLTQRAQTKGVDLDIACADNLPEVYCDADMVGRIITNLAVNAIKFSGEQGVVRLWAEADTARNQVVIGVTDNGPGMDPESLSRIFERFNQADGRVKATEKGFGLGLSIANQFCRLNLGEMSVRSRVGEGSTFSFHIPIANPPEVLTRWLETQCASQDCLRLFQVSVPRDASTPAVEDFDRFLNCLLRKNDLLFRADPGRWLLVMAAPACEADRWEAGVLAEFKKHNRNRPMGPLPEYHVAPQGQWDSVAEREAIFQAFRSSLATTESAPPANEPVCLAEVAT